MSLNYEQEEKNKMKLKLGKRKLSGDLKLEAMYWMTKELKIIGQIFKAMIRLKYSMVNYSLF